MGEVHGPPTLESVLNDLASWELIQTSGRKSNSTDVLLWEFFFHFPLLLRMQLSAHVVTRWLPSSLRIWGGEESTGQREDGSASYCTPTTHSTNQAHLCTTLFFNSSEQHFYQSIQSIFSNYTYNPFLTLLRRINPYSQHFYYFVMILKKKSRQDIKILNV